VEPGWVVWITGLAGSGKTTISREVGSLIRSRTGSVFLLDGDRFREAMGNDLGYDVEDRLKNALRICRMAAYLSEQGIHVVVATISLFSQCHVWNRENLPRFLEVLVEVDEATLRSRNQKQLHEPGVQDVMGVDQTPEFPESPDVRIQNDEGAEPAVLARRIVDRLEGL
jgi:adenylylsulfate kinase